MNFFGIGAPEIGIIVLIILVLFGPKDLPEIARKIGGATKQMRDTLNSVNDEMTGMIETVKKIEDGQMIPPLVTDAPKPPAAPSAATLAVPSPQAAVLSEPGTTPTSHATADADQAITPAETVAATLPAESAAPDQATLAPEISAADTSQPAVMNAPGAIAQTSAEPEETSPSATDTSALPPSSPL